MQLKNIEIGFLMNYLRTLAGLKLNKQKMVKIAGPDKSSLKSELYHRKSDIQPDIKESNYHRNILASHQSIVVKEANGQRVHFNYEGNLASFVSLSYVDKDSLFAAG